MVRIGNSKLMLRTTALLWWVNVERMGTSLAFTLPGSRNVFSVMNRNVKNLPVTSSNNNRNNNNNIIRLQETKESETDFFFATKAEDQTQNKNKHKQAKVQTRTLGSQELLMLPRQYAPHLNEKNQNKDNAPFPQMSHVCAATLSSTPSISTLELAIDEAMNAHPLLRCYVSGSGEPDRRIDLFQMVREGEPDPCTFVCPPVNDADADNADDSSRFRSKDVLRIVDVDDTTDGSLEQSWKDAFANNLDGEAEWCDVSKGPLWKVELHRSKQTTNMDDNGIDGQSCALVFTFNHAISDQTSANLLVDHIVSNLASIEQSADGKTISRKAISQTIPVAMEDSVLGSNNRWSDVQTKGLSINTLQYVAGKAAEGFRSPVILPDDADEDEDGDDGSGILGALATISGRAPGGESDAANDRRSTCQFRSLSPETTDALLAQCRENGVTVSNALSAAIALTATDFIGNGNDDNDTSGRNYKVLQSLDMRRFGASLDKAETVACMAGSHDLMYGPLPDRSGERIRRRSEKPDTQQQQQQLFWELAKEGKKQTSEFISSGGPQQATRVFDFAMTIADMNNLIHLTAQSKSSQGRAYSAGIVNAGVFERQKAVLRDDSGQEQREPLSTQHGKYAIQDVYFATSHARTGCLYQASCMTINGKLQCTFHPAMPIVSPETNAQFADSFVDLLEIVAGVKVPQRHNDNAVSTTDASNLLSLTPNLINLFAAVSLVGSLAIHGTAWSNFFSSIAQMKNAVADPADFWAALNFWIFFAVGHPLLQPVLWISDVLHGTPGPKLADLVPVLFLLGNAAFIALVSASKEVRNCVNVVALSAFLSYVGAGLDGQAGLGDFNLALDDSYKGQVVKGCPSYEEVRQPSMDNFDIRKYQGLWYEQKFHDWTQFKEVYDTTLDIKLTEDGRGWIDDFGVKGPAPDAAKLSWDKSPVANGAHYFLFGRVDENDAPGILRESGFGVEFPNYIVDVQTDPNTGEYTEAIQFQCLERGGVRVFEGINFMSRKPVMSSVEMDAMHARAERAGMFPYGAGPEQMHAVARRDVDAPPVDNSWQQMWRAIGVDRLLELLTESIEDGGR